MNKFKKILTGVVVAAGISCLGGAIACSEAQPNYYTLSFEGTGLDYIMQGDLAVPDDKGNPFQSGTVKEGVEVRFKVLLGGNTTGSPKIVLSDGREILPDADGVYSFIMSGNTVVKAEGLTKLVSVNLHKGEKAGTDATTGTGIYSERRVTYVDKDGKDLGDVVRIEEGGSLKFKLKVSPYYKRVDEKGEPVYSIIYGDEEMLADADGFYTITDIKGDNRGEQHLSVNGLTEADAFFARENCGEGTEADPYLISEPIDLFNIAALVNSSSYGMNTAHFKLNADIDMEGEQLFIIGDMTTESAVFAGTFDGAGHTIKNFYITDEGINQETFQKGYVSNVGLFGCAVATVPTGSQAGGPVQIKNLKLDNYTVTAHPDKTGVLTCVGSLVGNSIGLQVTNCSATNGKIVVEGDNNTPVFMGGLVGYMQAGYHTSSGMAYDAYVQSSYTDVDMDGRGLPRGSGGMVGYLVSAAANATANVTNCYTLGDVNGGMYAGGIVGLVGRYSTIANCYATGEVYSGNNLSGANVIEDARYAYAGGIAGYAYDDTVISGCYSANSLVEAYSASGSSYQSSDAILGGHSTADNRSSAESSLVILLNNKKKENNETFADLNWSSKDWNLEGELPTLKYSAASRELTVLIKGGAADVFKGKIVSEFLPSMHLWYGDSEGELNEYYNEGALRTGGYFFDSACTLRVPYGYVPTADQTTLYVKFVNYSEVAGTYYVRSDDYTTAASFELTLNGEVRFRQGGMSFNGVYSYDGEKVVMYNTCLANLTYDVMQVNGQYFSLVGTKTESGFDLYGIAINLIDTENSTQESVEYFEAELNYVAIKKNTSFEFGEYLTVDGKGKYTFLENMTGLYTGEGGAQQFSFAFTGNDGIELSYLSANNQKVTWLGTVSNGKVTTLRQVGVNKADKYSGKWTKSANSGVSFTFDGQAFVTVTIGNDSQTVGYTASGDMITFDVGAKRYEAYIDANTGALVVNDEIYYKGTGVTGSWYLSGIDEHVDISFEGLGADGYGYATIFYVGNAVLNLDAQYDVTEYANSTVIRLFVGDSLFGELALTDDYDVLGGSFFSYNQQGYYANASFYLYDNFRGTWTSNINGIDNVKFNGKNANGKGEVTLGSSSKKYSYELTDAFTGTIKISDEVTYQITFDEATGKINMKEPETFNGQLAQRDTWYRVQLNGSDGNTYTFDGKGYIGGTVTVTGATSGTLTYTVDGNGAVTLNGTPLTATANGLSYGSVTLSFDTGFAGEWLVSGTGKTLVITEVDGNFNAKVSYGGSSQKYDFKFNPSTSSLTYVYEDEGGTRYTATLNLATGKTEMVLGRKGGNEDLYLNCMQVSLADDYMGEFIAVDGSGSWIFDGLGKSVYGSGSVKHKVGTVTTTYSYKINVLNSPVITMSAGTRRYGFMPVKEGGYKKTGSDTAYDLIVLDEINGKTAQMGAATYAFDGVSAVYRLNDGGEPIKIYTYTGISSTEADIEDTSGNKFLGQIENDGGLVDVLKLTPYGELYNNRVIGFVVKDDLGNQSEEFYVFKDDGKLYKRGENGKQDEAVYEYTVVSAYKVMLKEIDGGKEYVGEMKKYTSNSGKDNVRMTLKDPEEEAKGNAED